MKHATKRTALLWGLAAATQLAAWSCRSSDEGGDRLAPPPLNNSQPWDGPAAAHVRVEIALAAGAPQILRASRLTTRPLPQALGGELMAVAWANDGTIVDAVPVRLDTVVRSAGFDGLGNFVESEEEIDPGSASASVFLLDHPALDRIEIFDASGAVAATVLTSDIDPEMLASSSAPPERRTSALTKHPDHEWVELLAPGDVGMLPDILQAVTTGLVPPTADQLDLIDECLATMSEASRRSVKRIAIGNLPNHGVTMLPSGGCTAILGAAVGSAILMNAEINDPAVDACFGKSSLRRRFINTCVHEAAHNFTFLVAAVGTPGSSLWPAEAQKIAQEKVQSYGLSAGLTDLFARLQLSAVNEAESTKATYYYKSDGKFGPDGMPLPDSPLGPRPANNALAVRAGFANSYGAQNPLEDVGMYASEIQAPDVPPGTEPEICKLFAQASVLSELTAIQYAKALLLRNIGLVDEERFAACTHGFGVDAPPGIGAEGYTFQFTDSLNFGYFDLAGERMFGVAGDGADTYQALLRVKVKDGKPPLGLHRLDYIGYFDIDDAENGFLLANDDSFLARTSTGGLALITEITPHMTSGAIFFLKLGALGIVTTQTFPLVTFRVSK